MGNKHKKHSADKERTDVLKNKKKNDNDIGKKRKKGKKKGKKNKQETRQKEKKQGKEKARKEEERGSEQKKKYDEKEGEVKEKIKVNIKRKWKELRWYLVVICIFAPIAAFIFEKLGYERLLGIKSIIGIVAAYLFKQAVLFVQELKNNGLYDEKLSLQLWEYLKKNFSSMLHNRKRIYFGMTVLIIVALAVLGSKYTVFARIKEGASAFKTSFQNYEGKEETEPKEEDKNEEEVIEKTENAKEELIPEIADATSGEDLYVYTEEEIIKQFGFENYMEAKNILMTYEDKNLEVDLSDDDYDQIFFQNGKYKVEDWNNQAEIDEKVLQSIEDAVAQNNQNIFDGSAPGDLKNKIDALGKKGEKKITFAERIEITEFRKTTYEQYPKSTLALLSANDNQAYALAFVLIGGKQQTQMYYYGQSVLWGLKYISYEDVSDHAIRQRINWIAKRYEDIRFICLKEEAEYMYADKLMIAYRHAAASF